MVSRRPCFTEKDNFYKNVSTTLQMLVAPSDYLEEGGGEGGEERGAVIDEANDSGSKAFSKVGAG